MTFILWIFCFLFGLLFQLLIKELLAFIDFIGDVIMISMSIDFEGLLGEN
jgi:hypothetical protein